MRTFARGTMRMIREVLYGIDTGNRIKHGIAPASNGQSGASAR
ncbi:MULTISPECIES: hypothetical protein [Streptomyces]|nr:MULTISPECIES: hypothetical protein [Streptomyces]